MNGRNGKKSVRKELTRADLEAFEPAEKIGIVATVGADGLPHLTLITTLQGRGGNELIVGEFCKGQSKLNFRRNRKISFLVLSLDKRYWRGRAEWTSEKSEGEEFEKLNMIPMFRYNTYFGINTVHYFRLREIEGPHPLPMGRIILSSLATLVAKQAAAPGEGRKEPEVMNFFARKLFDQMDSLSFLSYISEDGFPGIVPVIQARPADTKRLVFSFGIFADELERIPPGRETAVFCANLRMQSVLVGGTYRGAVRRRGVRLGTVEVDKVYNSMPPAHGPIYPPVTLEGVADFGGGLSVDSFSDL